VFFSHSLNPFYGFQEDKHITADLILTECSPLSSCHSQQTPSENLTYRGQQSFKNWYITVNAKVSKGQISIIPAIGTELTHIHLEDFAQEADYQTK
jgi:hypothetical protein